MRGELGPHLSACFGEVSIAAMPDGMTIISGEVVDQAALHGMLARIRDLGIELIDVHRVDPDGS